MVKILCTINWKLIWKMRSERILLGLNSCSIPWLSLWKIHLWPLFSARVNLVVGSNPWKSFGQFINRHLIHLFQGSPELFLKLTPYLLLCLNIRYAKLAKSSWLQQIPFITIPLIILKFLSSNHSTSILSFYILLILSFNVYFIITLYQVREVLLHSFFSYFIIIFQLLSHVSIYFLLYIQDLF